MSWRKTIQQDTGKSWRDTISQEQPDVSMLESGARGVAQGLSLGFADEITGGIESLFTDKSYEQARDESRAAYEQAEEANPLSYGAGNIAGAVGTAVVAPLGAASLAGRIGAAATMGGVAGIGSSEAEGSELARDAAKGAVLGGAFQGIGEKVIAPVAKGAMRMADDVISAGVRKVSPAAHKVLPKAANMLSGVDDGAALRVMQRPAETALAESDDFALKLGRKAVAEADEMGTILGKDVSRAKESFLSRAGGQEFGEASVLKMEVEDFLRANKPSQRGFSAISDTERDAILNLKQMLDGPISGEDLVKVREYLDHVKRLATKYDADETGPVVNFLKGLRGKADSILDRSAPDIDQANTAFSQYADDIKTLSGSTNENRAESMVNNLYGRNKGAQQEAAERIWSGKTLDSAKDIAANKAFGAAQGPAGSEFGVRRLLPVMQAPALIPAFSPEAWKGGLRSMGRMMQTLSTQPQVFGRYADVLTKAAERGSHAVAATHYILSNKDPEYRRRIQMFEGSDE